MFVLYVYDAFVCVFRACAPLRRVAWHHLCLSRERSCFRSSLSLLCNPPNKHHQWRMTGYVMCLVYHRPFGIVCHIFCLRCIHNYCVCVCVFDFQKKTAPTYDEEPSEQLKFLEAIVMKNMQAETLGNYGVTSCNKTGTHFFYISQIRMTIYIFLPF